MDGAGRTRTCEGLRQRVYSPPPLPLGTRPHVHATRTKPTMGFEPMTDRLQGGCSAGLSYVGAPPSRQQRRTSAMPAACRVRIAARILLLGRRSVNGYPALLLSIFVIPYRR